MPNGPNPSYPQVLEIPPGLTPAQFQLIVSDRIRDLNLLLKGVAFNPGLIDLSMGSFRITNLADPTDDLDAVNLRTLRRGASAPVAQATTASSGLDAYTIVFNVPGFLGPDELIPAFVVGRDRVGRPAEAWVYALGPPASVGAAFNVTKNGVNLLASDLALPVGANGPAFSTSIVGGVAFAHGDVIALVPESGSASGISFGLIVERT